MESRQETLHTAEAVVAHLGLLPVAAWWVDRRITDPVALRAATQSGYPGKALCWGGVEIFDDAAHGRADRSGRSPETVESVLRLVRDVMHAGPFDRVALIWVVELVEVVGDEHGIAALCGIPQEGMSFLLAQPSSGT